MHASATVAILDHAVALDASSWDIHDNDALQTLLCREEPLWVLNGHTHRRGVWSRGQLTVINGGTLYREHGPCFGLVDLERAAWSRAPVSLRASPSCTSSSVPPRPAPREPSSRPRELGEAEQTDDAVFLLAGEEPA
jgi:hypothetical protein